LLFFDYGERDRTAILSWGTLDESHKWLKILITICLEVSDEAERQSVTSVTLPWWSFLGIRQEILEVISAFNLKAGIDFKLSSAASEKLNEARVRHDSFSENQPPPMSKDKLLAELKNTGFERNLTNEQVRNVLKLLKRPNGATFSVPGAGKTTEALAFYALKAAENDKLLVVAPKNAFAAWDEQISECMPSLKEGFIRLRQTDKISLQLLDRPKLLIIGYQQLTRVSDRISQFLSENDVHVFLDESHRIKNINSLSAQAILKFSHLPKGKLIMSGTPMPQSVEDLVPQFQYLYPEVPATAGDVISLIQKVYVRTNKAELNLPKVSRRVVSLAMDASQEKLYRLLKSELAREAEKALSENTRFALRKFGRSVTTVLQFVSNPGLLAEKPEFRFSSELSDALAEGDGPKMRYVIERTRMLAKDGHKILIWTSFVKNVEYLAECLRDLGAVYIHGGVDAGSDADEATREGKIKKFHDDTNTQVMVANPAAASEGISLHRVCHHAIYLDRNFNAAQYLQSEDRIHRLGLKQDQLTNIEVVECKGTIDETVRFRLESKVNAMAIALEDSSLNISPIQVSDDELSETEGIALDTNDFEALVETLRE
jgi:SNF2 family DNA or RNA helicase